MYKKMVKNPVDGDRRAETTQIKKFLTFQRFLIDNNVCEKEMLGEQKQEFQSFNKHSWSANVCVKN
jgi:hypothetical protein